MRRILSLLVILSLSACVGDTAGPIDTKKFFASLEGPKVPTMQDMQMEAAKNAEKEGNFQAASQYYQQMLEKNPDNKEMALALAETYRRSGDNDRAIALYEMLLQKDPSMLGAKEGKALALMAKGDFDTPTTLFDEIMKADATRWKTLNALGILFTTRNMHVEAQQYFQAALKQNPSSPTVLNNLGLSQALNRQSDEAVASLSQASALTAAGTVDRKRIDLNLALVYAISGKLDQANIIAEQYFTGPVLDNNRGLYAHLAKDDQMAKAYLNMALTESKTFYEKAWNNLQQIDSASANASIPLTPQQVAPSAAAPAAVPTPEAAPAPVTAPTATPAPPAEKPVKKPVKKAVKAKPKAKAPLGDEDIADIVGSTDEKKEITKDSVQDSPIP
jgi:Flp pilus assembly protein TadD